MVTQKFSLARVLLEWEVQRQQSRAAAGPGLSPSSVDIACERQTALRLHGVEGAPIKTGANTVGSLLHLAFAAVEGGGNEAVQFEVPVTVPHLRRSGTADRVDFDQREVDDYKTLGRFKFDRWEKQGPPQGPWDQLSLYGLGLQEQHGGDWTLRIVAVCRETGRIAEWTRPLDPVAADFLAQGLRATDDRLSALQDPMEAAPGGTNRNNFPCGWCEFVDLCYDEEGLTDTGAAELPDHTTAALVEEYETARLAEAEAAARKEAARLALVGHEGTFGQYRLSWSHVASQEVLDGKRARAVLQANGLEVPTKTRNGYDRIVVEPAASDA